MTIIQLQAYLGQSSKCFKQCDPGGSSFNCCMAIISTSTLRDKENILKWGIARHSYDRPYGEKRVKDTRDFVGIKDTNILIYIKSHFLFRVFMSFYTFFLFFFLHFLPNQNIENKKINFFL